MPNQERRRFERADTEIACKVRRTARTVFSPGRTINVSASGAAIELRGPREACIGERIAVAFEHAQCPVTRAAHMVTATIVRVIDAGEGLQQVGLSFDTPQFGLEVLDRPIAA
ncbi:MAG: PilZ domain-containing protein [Phycisphaerales bacterium]